MPQVQGVRARIVAVLACLVVWLWPGANAVAVPACPGPVTVQQPDGRQIKIHLRGDEFVHWHEDEAGFTILKDAPRGRWIYARPDRQGNLVATDLLVGRDDPTRLGVARHLVPRNTGTRSRVPGAGQASAAGTQDAPLLAPKTGTMKNLVLLVQFPDLMGTRTKAEFDALFNTLGYTTDGAVGSVRDYYREVSHNTLDVVSTITDWITVTNGYAYYGGNDASGNDLHPREMVQEALTKLEANGFDFSTLDADGDGWVDGLTVIHAGGGEEYSGNDPNYIWSHKWSMLTTLTFDGKSMRDYHTEPERRGWDSSPSTQGITRIGVICHETGHFLGLPDLYDTDYNSEGVGNFCLMAGGSWNGNYGTSPAHMSAWCKKSLNWVTPTLVTAAGTYTAPRVEDSMTVFRLSGAFPSTQYFLVENRQGYGFDAALPGSTRGLLIWHVDETQSSNNDQTHYMVDLEEASGTQHLELNLNGGDDADYYRQANNTSFTASSTPNNLSYSGTPLNLNISSVSAAGATMTFTIAPLPIDHFDWDPITSPRSAGSPFAVTVTARDYFGGTATGFSGTANLSGLAEGLVTAGTGTSAWAYPLATSSRVDRTQVIYLASEVGGARTITALELYVTTVPGQTLNNWTIRMKHTSLSSYPASPAWEGSGWTTVYQSNRSVAATGWVRFTFTTPFAFNGADNLMVDYSFNNSSTAADGQCRFTAAGSNRSIYCGTTSRYGDPLTWSGTSSPKPNASVNVPNIRLASQSAVTISPTTSGSFVNGVWTGNMTVLQTAPSMVLLASDGAGHSGASASFAVDVGAVNQAPTLDAISDVTVNEDSGPHTVNLTGISAGPGETQTLTVTAVSDNLSLVPNPSVTYTSPNATGSLTFTPVANGYGSAGITVTVKDDGGTAGGGVDTTTRSFTVTVNPVNDPPTISDIADQVVNEDTATAALPFTVGDVETPAASLGVSGSSSNPTLVPDANIVFGGSGANRTVTVTPAANRSGTATITVTVSDGTASASDSFVLTVNAVNDAPSFVGGPNKQVAQNADAQSFANWATAISAGPPDEASQVLSFSVTSDKTYLFSTQPLVSPTGTLTFTPNGNYRGTANLTVTLHDNGGTANGGQDASPGYPFTITVGLDADGNGNGLPDDWEIAYFGAPGVLPGDDSDGDGFTNAEEFAAGTNPANPADAPGITGIQPSGTDVIVSFRTLPGKSYRVDRGDQPVGGTWSQVGITVPGTGEVLSVTDPGRVADQKCFYRVVVLP